MVEQWCIRVPVQRGEELRRLLIEEGVLDLSLKVRRDGSHAFTSCHRTARRSGSG